MSDPLPPDPLLSVVMPVHDALPWLEPCLDSVLAQEGVRLELVCVDDGSTDGSGAVLARRAADDPRLRVLTVENGGPGRARNLGVAAANGDLLAFADADDLVPPGAYARMVAAMRASGSDLVVGGVLRTTTERTWPSGLHGRAIKTPATGTHISRTPSLLYDATMWNKLYRRDLWDRAGLSFSESSRYEDIVPALAAHVHAKAVDVLTEPVYLWRLRDDGVASRSNMRHQLESLDDRFAALDEVDALLAGAGLEDLRRHLQVRVLDVDLPVFLDALPAADDTVRRRLAEEMRRRLATAPPDEVARLQLLKRVGYGLARRGHERMALRLFASRERVQDAARPAVRALRRLRGAA